MQILQHYDLDNAESWPHKRAVHSLRPTRRVSSLLAKHPFCNLPLRQFVSGHRVLHSPLGKYVTTTVNFVVTTIGVLSDCQTWSPQPHVTSAGFCAVYSLDINSTYAFGVRVASVINCMCGFTLQTSLEIIRH